jgi:hypothetical protein|tara:strand:- start:697 stop:873 length:177 start_codon:yes stop_codon:yes gene_type:complete
MSGPKVELEDELFRRHIQDMLDKLADPKELKSAAEMLADSLVQTRAAMKWVIGQNMPK